jgi:hypothetical protein
MSKITVKELEAPSGFDLKIASGETLDLNSQGTVILPTIPSNKMPVGSIVQVQYAYINTAVTTSSSTMSDIGITASITPTSASNDLFIEWFAPDNRKETNATNLAIDIYRQINGGGYSVYNHVLGGWGWTNSNVTFSAGSSSIFKDDSYNTTNQVDYKMYIASGQGSAKVTINKDGKSQTGIRIMEVVA